MRVHPSARKHGVAPEDAIQAAEWALWIEPLTHDESPARNYASDSIPQARLLETVVVILAPGDEMVIHAMPARKKYLDLPP